MAVIGLLLAGCHSGASGRRRATTNTTRPTFVAGASSAGFTVLVGRDSDRQPCASLRFPGEGPSSSATSFAYQCPSLNDSLDVEQNLSGTDRVLWGVTSKRVSRIIVKAAGNEVSRTDVVQTSGLYSYVVVIDQAVQDFTIVALDSSGRQLTTVRSDEVAPPVPRAPDRDAKP